MGKEKTYLVRANERLDYLENRIVKVFSTLDHLMDDNYNNGSLRSTNKELIKYIKWTLKCLNNQKNLLEKVKKVKKEDSLRLFGEEEANFLNKTYSKLSYYENQYKLMSSKFNLIDSQSNNPQSDLLLNINNINGMKPSELMKCFIMAYNYQLDPDGFWFSRNDLIRILNSENNSLLKHMLLHAISNVIDFGPENNLKLLFQSINFEHMIIKCYSKPSMDNITALALLTCESLFKGNLIKSKYYFSSALKMGEILSIVPNETNEEFSNLNGFLPWKHRTWELLIFLQIYLNELDTTHFMMRNIQPVQFLHLRNKVPCVPILARISSNKPNLIPPSRLLKEEFNNTDLLAISTSHSKELTYFTDALSRNLYLSQHLINYKAILNLNPNINPINRFYKDKATIISLINELDITLFNTPTVYKIYHLSSEEQVIKMDAYGLMQPDYKPNLGSYGYYLILLNKIILVDPISLISPCRHELPDIWYWKVALEAADDIWELFSTLFYRKKIESEKTYNTVNVSTDVIPVCSVYFNALCQTNISNDIKNSIYFKLSELFNWLKNISQDVYTFDDFPFTISKLKKILLQFDIPEQYVLNL